MANSITYNPDAEAALVASAVSDQRAWSLIGDLAPDVFVSAVYQAIWSILRENNGHASFESIVGGLGARRGFDGDLLSEFGGPPAVTTLLAKARSIDEVEHLVELVIECDVNRQTKHALEKGINSFEPAEEPLAAHERIEQVMNDLSSISVGNHLDVAELLRGFSQWSNEYEWRLANPGKMSGIRTHFRDLDDRVLEGLEPGNLWVVASSPGEGKSIFVGEVALRMALRPQDTGEPLKVAIFGVEMTGKEIAGRFIQSLAMVDSHKLRNPHLIEEDDRRRLISAKELFTTQVLANLLYLGPAQFGSIDDICRQTKHMIREYGVGCVIVDYIQRVGAKHRDKRTEEIGDITSKLKALAVQCNIPIIGVSQVTRESVKTQNGKATLWDLADSAAVERDADYVSTLWRPSRHLEGKARQIFQNVVLLELVKGRFRETSTCYLRFDGALARYDDLDYNTISTLRQAESTLERPHKAKA